MTAALSINLNKVALIRNSRDSDYPSVTDYALRCIKAGADGITVHPRPDQRHIRVTDCYQLAEILEVEFNIEGNPFAGGCKSTRQGVADYPGFMTIIRDLRPAQCTLVPDSDDQLTSDHGFNLHKSGDTLRPIIEELNQLGVRVSLFMDPDPTQMELARSLGADRIELYTETYARACEQSAEQAGQVLQQFVATAQAANDAGLGVNAGHDLNLNNLAAFASAIPQLLEVSIGHAFTVDCLEYGIDYTMGAYQQCLASPS